MGLLFAASGGFKQLAIISGAATLIIYLGVVLASFKLRGSDPGKGEKSFRIPGGIVVPILATCTIVWLLSHLSKAEFTSLVVFILLFSGIYIAIKFLKARNNHN
jgi:L-asparagine transporter-like permease